MALLAARLTSNCEPRGVSGQIAILGDDVLSRLKQGFDSPRKRHSLRSHTRTLQAFMGHRSVANTVVYTAVADKRIRNIWVSNSEMTCPRIF